MTHVGGHGRGGVFTGGRVDSETRARSEARRGQSTDEHGGNETKLLSELRAQWVKTTRMGGSVLAADASQARRPECRQRGTRTPR